MKKSILFVLALIIIMACALPAAAENYNYFLRENREQVF